MLHPSMSRSLFLMPFLLLCRMVLYCQADSIKQEPYVHFNAVSAITGFNGLEYRSPTLDHFKSLTPGNTVSNSVPVNVKEAGGTLNAGNVMLNLGANLHLKTKDFKTRLGVFSSEWRVGLNIATNVRQRFLVKNQVMQRTDTFYSDHTSMVKYEGRTTDDIYQYSYKSKNVFLDISKTYHTNQLRRLSFYTGINAGIGCTFNNYVDVTFTRDTVAERHRPYRNLEKNDGALTERTNLRSELYYVASIPVGIVLRNVIKRKQKAYRFSVFAEGRLGYRFQKNYNNAYSPVPLGAVQLGTKIYFNKQSTKP